MLDAPSQDSFAIVAKRAGCSLRSSQPMPILARHDVKVQIVTIPAADIDVANAILSHIADISGTLIVMGGYGHAKLREIILGGVTRDMLKSMTVPVFISHRAVSSLEPVPCGRVFTHSLPPSSATNSTELQIPGRSRLRRLWDRKSVGVPQPASLARSDPSIA